MIKIRYSNDFEHNCCGRVVISLNGGLVAIIGGYKL
jgi:hypothetical protein